jgi:hypothetical protein
MGREQRADMGKRYRVNKLSIELILVTKFVIAAGIGF